MFDQCIGNRRIKVVLERMLVNQCLPSVMLFAGIEGIGKGVFAEALAKKLSTNQTDLHILKPEGKIGMHSIAHVRALINEMALPPYSSEKKIFIIHDAERMLPTSSNALLKTLEEPPLDTIIILLATKQEALLPTVLSRCRIFPFQPLTQEELQELLVKRFGKKEADASQMALHAQGSLRRALSYQDPFQKEVEEIVYGLLESPLAYPQLTSEIALLCDKLDREKKIWEKEAQASFPQIDEGNINIFDKEIEGAIAMRSTHVVESLLDTILQWHRDCHLLALSGDGAHLHNPHKKEALQKRLQNPRLIPLDNILTLVDKALLSFQRSMPLPVILETLFLSV